MKRYRKEQRGTLVALELEGPGSLAVGWWVGSRAFRVKWEKNFPH